MGFKRIDFYSSKVCSLRCDDGNLKYPHLFPLVRCVSSLSHWTSVPERGFSINKYLLDVHASIKEDAIISVRLFTDEFCRVGGVMKFDIKRKFDCVYEI